MTGGMAYVYAGVRHGSELKYMHPQVASLRNNLLVRESGKREWIFWGTEGLEAIERQGQADDKLLATSNRDGDVA